MSNPNETIETIRRNALCIFQSGVTAADPYRAVKNSLIVNADHLEIRLSGAENSRRRTGAWPKIHLIAFGKAACAMIKAAREIIPEHLLAGNGIAVTNYDNVTHLDNVNVIGAGHPLPDEAGFKAAQMIAEQLSHAQQDDLVLVLVSGGGSALIPYPVESVSLEDKCAVTGLLLASGADINQINCVRKHLSRLKGGGLARMAYPADCHALILSDVLGDDLSSIASGPTVPDGSTFADAVSVLVDRQLWHKAPASIRAYLERGKQGLAPETPKPGDKLFAKTGYTLIGSNAISLNATRKAAQNLGYETVIYSDRLSGIARETAELLAVSAKIQIKKNLAPGTPFNKPIALLAGGETTVILTGHGRGGRNQEMALAFALAAEKHKLPGPWVFLSGGTDGRDGPTDAAGGIVDQESLKRMVHAGINPVEALDDNDSHTALETSEDLLDTGATGTNVADLQVLLIHPEF